MTEVGSGGGGNGSTRMIELTASVVRQLSAVGNNASKERTSTAGDSENNDNESFKSSASKEMDDDHTDEEAEEAKPLLVTRRDVESIVGDKIQEEQLKRPDQFQEEFTHLLGQIDQELGSVGLDEVRASQRWAATTTQDEEAVSKFYDETTRSSTNHGTASTSILVAFRRALLKLEQVEERGNEKLPQDTFSYIMILPSRVCTIPFFYALTIISVQVMTLVLVMVDTIGTAAKDYNSLNLPADVDLEVRLAQIIALLIIVFTQDDVITGLAQLGDGYHKSLKETFSPEITSVKWFVSIMFRLFVGWLVLFVAFLLVVQEESVVDIFLNFLAVSFVSQLDNMAHILAIRGFAGETVQFMARVVQETKYKKASILTINAKCYRDNARRLLMLVVLSLVLAAWSLVVHRQNSEYLLTPNLFVQFGDDFVPALGTFSGIYSRSGERVGGRATYVENRSGRAMLGYCSNIQAWTFTYGEQQGDLDPCVNFVARSTETTTYDIMTTVSSPWYDHDEDLGELPMQHIFFRSFDCRDDGVCGLHGQCSDYGRCLCDDGWFGLRCEFPVPCEFIETDERKEGFLGARLWSASFQALKDSRGSVVEVYNRPIFVKDSEVDNVLDVILFTGRRWMVSHSGLFTDFTPPLNTSVSALKTHFSSYLTQDFHAYWSNYSVAFVSEAVDVGTPSDSATPVSVLWYNNKFSLTEETATVDETQRLDATLICSICDNEANRCFFESVCRQDGVCECTTGASGTLCQVPPTSNGRCNPFFNNPEWQYDGGDCCQATCRNSEEYFCGTDVVSSGLLLAYVGFDNCQDPTQACESCWKPFISTPLLSSPTDLQSHTFFRNTQYMALSGDGRSLAVHDGVFSKGFQVYSIERSQWIKRGGILTNSAIQGYVGSAVALSREGWVVAIAGADTVQAYEWGTTGWLERGQLLDHNEPDQHFDLGNSVALNGFGDVVACGFISPGAVIVYDITEGGVSDLNSNFAQNEWVQRGDPVISKGDDVRTWSALSLSEDGNTLAVGVRAQLEPGTPAFDLSSPSFGLESAFELENEEVVQVFRWNGTAWDQLGKDIFVPELFLACFGCTLSLAGPGDVLAVGAPEEDHELLFGGAARVFEWDGSSWSQRGSTIYGDKENLQFGSSVTLSKDASVLAVGTEPITERTSTYRTYVWEENDWVLLDSLDVGTSAVGWFSDDKSLLAVSSMVDGRDDVIETNVYQFRAPPKQCDDGESLMRFSLLTDGRGGDIHWRVEDGDENTLFEKEEYYYDDRSTSVIHEWCVPSNNCTTLKVFDFGGDGLCCDHGEGAFVVWVDGVEVASAGEFRWYKEVQVGSCEPKCTNGTSLFRMELMLDDQGSETLWSVKDDNQTIVFEEGGRYPNDVNGIVVRETCLPPEECHTFTMEDTCIEGFFGLLWNDPECGLGFDVDDVEGSGYRVSFDDIEMGDSDNFILHRTHYLGNCTLPCDEGLSLLRFLLRTDQAGQQTTWEIESDTGNSTPVKLLEGGPYGTFSMTADVQAVCIDTANSCTTVTVYDSGGDGMYGSLWGVGAYGVELDGEIIKFGASFGHQESTRIGNCAPTMAPTEEPSASPTTEAPTLSPTTMSPTVSLSPTAPAPECGNNTLSLTIQLILDSWPGETTWILSDGNTGNQISEGGPYSSSGVVIEGPFCVDEGGCSELTVFDSAFDGLFFGSSVSVLLEGELAAILAGTDFTYTGIIRVGDCL